MSKRGKRNPKTIQQKNMYYSLKCIINQQAYYDPFYAETICQTSNVELRNIGYEQYGEQFSCTYIPDVDKGYVLRDKRGRGAFQSSM